MSKRKILALALTVAMIAILAVGGTLAYFTDTEEATNTFTMGGVEIDLIEKFDPDKANLMPGVENKIEKVVSIKNTGESDAYVWYEWYIPTALDSINGSTGRDNILHVNSYGATWDKYMNAGYPLPEGVTVEGINDTWDHDPEVETGVSTGPEGYIRQETVDGVKYNVYLVLYHGKLASQEETTPAMNGAYLDKDLDMNADGEYTCFGKVVDFDFDNDINIIVKAYGIQADLADMDNDGDVDVYDAYKAYNS